MISEIVLLALLIKLGSDADHAFSGCCYLGCQVAGESSWSVAAVVLVAAIGLARLPRTWGWLVWLCVVGWTALFVELVPTTEERELSGFLVPALAVGVAVSLWGTPARSFYRHGSLWVVVGWLLSWLVVVRLVGYTDALAYGWLATAWGWSVWRGWTTTSRLRWCAAVTTIALGVALGCWHLSAPRWECLLVELFVAVPLVASVWFTDGERAVPVGEPERSVRSPQACA